MTYSPCAGLPVADYKELLDALNQDSAMYTFEERFVYKIDPPPTVAAHRPVPSTKLTRKILVESANILELFLIKDKLKGKKKPIKKKNHDAQQFSCREEGAYYLETTKQFFTNFNVTRPQITIIDDLKVCKSDLLDNICFVLACDPSFVFEGEERLEYFTRTYISLQKKKKIFKIPSKFIIYFNPKTGRVEISRDHSVLWFSNNTTTLSN